MALQDGTKSELARGAGLSLAAHFALTMSIALAIVSTASNYLLFRESRRLLGRAQEEALVKAAWLSADPLAQTIQLERLKGEREALEWVEKKVAKAVEDLTRLDGSPAQLGAMNRLAETVVAARDQRIKGYDELAAQRLWHPLGGEPEALDNDVTRSEIQYGPDLQSHGVAYSYQPYSGPPIHLLMPETVGESRHNLLGLFFGATFAIIVVGALVSMWVAGRVSRPLQEIVEDVRQISTGDLQHRTRAEGGGEIFLLARSIDRMADNLLEARENQIELQVRKREVEVAGEIREQLLPQTTPSVKGYALGHKHIASAALGGDFHDLIEVGGPEDRRIGLLVCEVSGTGLPSALVGATARAYLRSRLTSGGDPKAAMQDVNRQLVRDVHRGIAVASLYVLLDPDQGTAAVTCTGHKLPLIRYTGADKRVRLIHPEGIALGFDRGPVFDAKLETVKVPVDPGDRLVLVNSGAVSTVDEAGAELGEKALYAHIQRLGGLPTEAFLAKLVAALEAYRGEAPFPRDVSILTVARL
jgi:serine phosphatase RsbU (regulator of sigma subunit)